MNLLRREMDRLVWDWLKAGRQKDKRWQTRLYGNGHPVSKGGSDFRRMLAALNLFSWWTCNGLKCNLVYRKHWLETLVKLCSAGSSTDSYGRMSTTPGQKEHALSDSFWGHFSDVRIFSGSSFRLHGFHLSFADVRLSLRFRVRLIWNFSICSCTHTHTHLAHTYTHLPPSVLTPPPVDDFWGPHNGRQATWARLSCLSAGVGVCCASVCVCAGCLPGIWFGGLHYLHSQPAQPWTNKQVSISAVSFIWPRLICTVCKSTPEDLSIRFGVLSNFVSDETCRRLNEFHIGCRFQFGSFQILLLERNMEWESFRCGRSGSNKFFCYPPSLTLGGNAVFAWQSNWCLQCRSTGSIWAAFRAATDPYHFRSGCATEHWLCDLFDHWWRLHTSRLLLRYRCWNSWCHWGHDFGWIGITTVPFWGRLQTDACCVEPF